MLRWALVALPPRDEYRLRTVYVGLRAQFLAILTLIGYALLGGRLASPTLYWVAVAGAASGWLSVGTLPWRKVVDTRWELPVHMVWSCSNLVLIASFSAASGGAASPLVSFYALTTVYHTMVYGRRAQRILLVLALASYVVMQLFTEGHINAALLPWCGMMVLVHYLSYFLADALRHERLAVRELEELSRLKSEFVATASHELRTPLTIVKGLGETLEARWGRLQEHDKLDFLGRMNANSRALVDVVNILLDFSRLETGSLPVDRQLLSLDGLVDDVIQRIRPLLGERPLTVEVVPAWVHADHALLQRVVENLLVNAARHTLPDSAVRVGVRVEEGSAVVSVSDTGPGIAKDDLARIGTPFYRAGRMNTHESRGLGLGLALSREILQGHNAKLEIESECGKGTTFRFRLPSVSPQPVTSNGPSIPVHSGADAR